MSTVKIDAKELVRRFHENYEFLYQNRDNVAGFWEAMSEGDVFIKANPEFMSELANYRGDFMSSDREVAAMMFSLADMGVPEGGKAVLMVA